MEGKKFKINNTTDFVVDKISSLPDFILGNILSFLPTKEAVATSILSNGWKFAWQTVHNLDFYYNYNDSEVAWNEAEDMKFVRFVDRVLLLTDTGPLNKFSLVWNASTISSHINSWINTAITRNVRELYLSLGDGIIIDIPLIVFTCNSLQSLELKDDVYVPAAIMVFLPRLENLKLHCVHFGSEEACEQLINGCPMLHYLDLNTHFTNNSDESDDDNDDDFTCIISSASLRRLDISFEVRSRLKLKASSLESLKVSGSVFEISVENGLRSLVQVDFDMCLGEHDFPNNSIVEFVHALKCVKVLTLSTEIMRALSRATIKLSTEFKRLVKLVAKTYYSSLQDVLQSSDNLEDLIIYQLSYNGLHDHSKWTAPVEVPRCLSNSLKKVQLYDYKGLEDKREMIRYMLEHGSALEVMEIFCYMTRDGEKLEFLQEICKFPRKSPTCKVRFYVCPSKRQFRPLY